MSLLLPLWNLSEIRITVFWMKETLRMFLGQEPSLELLDLGDRGLALDILVDCFFVEWSKSRGRSIDYCLG